MRLPSLRQELSIFPAPSTKSGEPSYVIHDPTRNLYFQLDWLGFEILSRWDLSHSDLIVADINNNTTLAIEEASVAETLKFISESELIDAQQQNQQAVLLRAYEAKNQSWLTWLLHHYLFIRIPLWNPDKFLSNTTKVVNLFTSSLFMWLTGLMFVIGLLETSRQWETFSNSFIDMLTLNGLVAYSITFIAVKLCHELGHAYVAKAFGCQVPRMGIAFLVLFPMAYTDVNEVWRLNKKSQRLWVGAAGIVTELTIAIWALSLWAFLPEGSLKTGAFLLATTTWVSTVLVNISPFLRFDGYFLLMDYLEKPNLHSRVFDIARWKLRAFLFGINCNEPDREMSGNPYAWVLFAWGIWIYRLVVFIGIALLVYITVPKPLGPFLAWIEIYWFILKPIINEVMVWWKMKSSILKHWRSYLTLLGSFLFVALIVMPWNGSISAPAVMKSIKQDSIALPHSAQLKSLYVESGTVVSLGQLIAQFDDPNLHFRRELLLKKMDQVNWHVNSALVNSKAKENRQFWLSEQSRLASELKRIDEELANLSIRAPIAGVVEWLDMDYENNDWVEGNKTLARIIDNQTNYIIAYVDQRQLSRIAIDDKAYFLSDSGMLTDVEARISRVARDASRLLPDAVLASVRGGEIATHLVGSEAMPEDVLYQVILEINDPLPVNVASQLTGHVVIHGKRQSLAEPYWHSFIATLRREVGF